MDKPVTEGALLAPGVVICGDVTLEKDVNVWYGAVLRGDNGPIRVGQGSNIQDNCVLHDKTTIGKFCTIGHGAVVHGCTVGDNTLIGMGTTVLNGAVIGRDCIVGAGSLVPQGMVIPDGSMAFGSPAKIRRPLTEEEIANNRGTAALYCREAAEYAE